MGWSRVCMGLQLGSWSKALFLRAARGLFFTSGFFSGVRSLDFGEGSWRAFHILSYHVLSYRQLGAHVLHSWGRRGQKLAHPHSCPKSAWFFLCLKGEISLGLHEWTVKRNSLRSPTCKKAQRGYFFMHKCCLRKSLEHHCSCGKASYKSIQCASAPDSSSTLGHI